MSVSDPYKVLQVDSEAEREVIEAAYRRLARMYHPDVSPDPESHEKMIAINMAWEQLRDPVKRAAVDRARQRTTGTVAWVAASDAQARAAWTSQRRPEAQAPSSPSRPTSTSAQAPDSGGGSTSPGMNEQGHSPQPSSASPTAPRPWTARRVPPAGASAPSRPEGGGAAGPPPGSPSGSVLNFGRYSGWSLGEIARTEADYLEWLDRMPIGRTYQAEIDELLRAKGRRSAATADQGRGGAFRRR